MLKRTIQLIDDLGDVDTTTSSPTSSQALLWDGSDFVPNEAGNSGIGDAEDASYADGLFTDFTTTTPIGTAVDRFNEILLALAPPPAPALDNISVVDNGVAGEMSFGSSNAISGYTNVGTIGGGPAALDVNDTFLDSGGIRIGVFNNSRTINGTLNDDVAAHAFSFPTNAFGNADQGTIGLEVNGTEIHSENLITFGSGNSLNGNGSGFNLGAATPVEFEDETPLDLFKYRTGTWTVSPTDQRNGWNYIRVTHTVGSETTAYFEWLVDADTTTTTFAGLSISGLSMSGSEHLSGVEYHTGGTATFNATVDEHHRNTYSSSGSAITFPTTTNCSVSNTSVNTVSTPDWETKNQVLAQAITVTTGRQLDTDIAVSTRIDRTVQTDSTSSTSNGGYELLLDSNITGAAGEDNDDESFVAEGFRLQSDLDLTDINYASGAGNGPVAYTWAKTESLVGADAGHNNGLICYNGALRYPTQGANVGNFSTVTNGPASNVNYASATGNRVYLRYFYSSSTRQNFTFDFSVSGTTFVPVGDTLNSSDVYCELLAPNTTQNIGGTREFKDMVTAFTDIDSIGAYAGTYGSTIPTDWGATLGSRSTATSGNAIVIRITAADTWTGSINAIDLVFP